MPQLAQQADKYCVLRGIKDAVEAHRPAQLLMRTGGQSCLLARRLIEVGVRCVTIDFGGWDTHRENFSQLTP